MAGCFFRLWDFLRFTFFLYDGHGGNSLVFQTDVLPQKISQQSTLTNSPHAHPHLEHQVAATLTEALKHAQEQVGGLYEVSQEGAWLLCLIELAQQRQEDLTVLHQVKNVAWKPRPGTSSKAQFFYLDIRETGYMTE